MLGNGFQLCIPFNSHSLLAFMLTSLHYDIEQRVRFLYVTALTGIAGIRLRNKR